MTVTIRVLDDESVWNAFFLRYQPEALFQSWTWGDIQKKSGTQVTRYGIWDNDNLIGIFQVVPVRAKRGSFLHIRHGPILTDYSESLWNEVTNFLRRLTRETRCWFFRVSPLIESSEKNHTLFKKSGYRPAAIHAMDAELCWILSLDESEEVMLQHMRKTTRYEIRRAEKMGIKVNATQQLHDLHYFFDLYTETSKRQGFIQHKGIAEEFELFSSKNQATLYYATFEDKVIATAIILFVGNQGIYHHGASITSSPPGSYAIQWQAIQDAKKRGMKQYNFWGIAPSDSENHPWKGLTLFKKGFGGVEKQYIHAQDYSVSPFYLVPRTVETLRRMKKGY